MDIKRNKMKESNLAFAQGYVIGFAILYPFMSQVNKVIAIGPFICGLILTSNFILSMVKDIKEARKFIKEKEL